MVAQKYRMLELVGSLSRVFIFMDVLIIVCVPFMKKEDKDGVTYAEMIGFKTTGKSFLSMYLQGDR